MTVRWQWVVAAAVALWGSALAYSTVSARALYADGAYMILTLLLAPHRFNDVDFLRTFSLIVSQAPVLLGQKIGLDSVAAYAALYSVGMFVIPAVAMVVALFLARRQPVLFAANGFAIVVYGFGANFINTESNLLFGFAWLSVTILALDGRALVLRGVMLPALAIAMVRTHEGMLLVGPVLAIWAFVAAMREVGHMERTGLGIAVLLYLFGATIGLGGFLAPRDPGNAASFLSSALAYLRGPHAFLLLSGAAALAGTIVRRRRARVALAVASAVFGAAFVAGIVALTGFYSFSIYYHNRSFLTLSLPALTGTMFILYWLRPTWVDARQDHSGYALLLIPLAFAVAGDMVGTYRWNAYVHAFCDVLESPAAPYERLQALKQTGVRTAWGWTHPTMSILLRDRGSTAIVVNEPPVRWEPFDAAKPPSISEKGLCQAPLLGLERSDSFELTIDFTGGSFPSYISAGSGLSKTESWATWSEGPPVEVRFARPLPTAFDLHLKIGAAFGANKGAPIKVRAGERELTFTVDREPMDVTLSFRDVRDARTVSFHVPFPEAPKDNGAGDDPRKLGIALISMRVVPLIQPDSSGRVQQIIGEH